MLGLVCYRETHAQAPPVRRIAGVRFRTVYLRSGTGLRAQISRRAAAHALAREGVRHAAFLVDATEREYFARWGVETVSPVPLHRATAAAIVRQYIAQRCLDAHRATVAFAAEGVSPELRRAVMSLTADVRYVTLLITLGGEELARELRRERGVAARLAAPGEPFCADLTVCFDPCAAEGDLLALYDPALPVEYDSGLPNELLAALWQAGALDVERLAVRSVKLPGSE